MHRKLATLKPKLMPKLNLKLKGFWTEFSKFSKAEERK